MQKQVDKSARCCNYNYYLSRCRTQVAFARRTHVVYEDRDAVARNEIS